MSLFFFCSLFHFYYLNFFHTYTNIYLCFALTLFVFKHKHVGGKFKDKILISVSILLV